MGNRGPLRFISNANGIKGRDEGRRGREERENLSRTNSLEMRGRREERERRRYSFLSKLPHRE